MKFLIIALFAVAIVSATQNQTVSVSDDPLPEIFEFFQGVNSGLSINVTSDAFGDCEGNYWGAGYMTIEFFKYLFIDWGVDFAFLHGFLGISYEGFLYEWQTACEPVAYVYGNYFAKATYAFEEDPKTFWATVESNFASNEVEVIELAVSVAGQIKSADYNDAGEDFASIIKILLSTWL